jgi:putative membrane protein
VMWLMAIRGRRATWSKAHATNMALSDYAHSWTFPALPCISIAATWVVYMRGWWRVRRRRGEELPAWRVVCFSLGLISLWIAICSPIDALDDLLLAAHMTQHFLLMSVAPPLIVLGAPTVPLLSGLPRAPLRVFATLFRARWMRAAVNVIVHPLVAWIAMNTAYVVWHVTTMFELALRSENWHTVEHLCFFLTSLAFWWVVIQPWPSHPLWSRWAMIPYLLSADLVNTIVSAFLTFSGRVLYPTYEKAPRVCSLSAVSDQAAAGTGMWFFGSLVFLLAAVWVTYGLLKRVKQGETRPELYPSVQPLW